MLPYVYPGKDTNAILADIENADIPEIHKLMFEWVRKFTCESSSMGADDIDRLVAAGIPMKEIVEWANVSSTQTWFVMSADGGGISLERGAVVGGIGKEREYYHGAARETAPDQGPSSDVAEGSSLCWVETDEENLDSISDWANQRFEFIPNLFRATSLSPEYFSRHRLALELLEQPQSESLNPGLHAMVRRLVNRLNRGRYLDTTTQAQLCRYSNQSDQDLVERATAETADAVVLQFAEKLVRNAYKVTESDAEGFRSAGLDDEAYIDVLNTVSIQTSLDRLSNALGIACDEKPLLS